MKEKINCQEILDAGPWGTIVTDGLGNLLFINPKAENAFNLESGRDRGVPLSSLLPQTGLLVRKCLETGEFQLGRRITEAGAGMMVNVTPIRSEGRIKGALCSFQDLEEYEEFAQQLPAYEVLAERVETIFNYSTDGLWLYDRNGIVIICNETAKKFLDAPVKSIIGKSYQEIIDMGLLDRSVVPEVLKAKKQVSIISYTKDGKSEHAVTGTPIFDNTGNIESIVINVRDLTQFNLLKRQLEDNLMKTEKIKEELTELGLFELQEQEIIAESESMKQVLRAAMKMASFKVDSVLILGESGTGKGLLAKFIHRAGGEAKSPFIQINCAALPENLLEAELFGYEKGAFTGAGEKGKPGLFEVAHGGTLFLDEIGELPLEAQAKILTYLDDQTIVRVGGVKRRKVECTIIAATNRDLQEIVKNKKFREDLFFRLNTFTIRIPPLRERPEDILSLASYFLNKYNREFGQQRYLSPPVLDKLMSHKFRGNVREMKSIIKAAVVMSEQDKLDEFLVRLLGPEAPQGMRLDYHHYNPGLNESMLAYERDLLLRARVMCKTTRKMARFLNISQSAVMRRLKKHGLSTSG